MVKQQIIRIKPKLQNKNKKLENYDRHIPSDYCMFKKIIKIQVLFHLFVYQRMMIRYKIMIMMIIIMIRQSRHLQHLRDFNIPNISSIDNSRQSIQAKTNTSLYLKMIIEIVRDLTDECCTVIKLNRFICSNLF